MAVAPERERKEDYNRWRKALETRKTPPTISMACKRMKHIDWYDYSDEEHY